MDKKVILINNNFTIISSKNEIIIWNIVQYTSIRKYVHNTRPRLINRRKTACLKLLRQVALFSTYLQKNICTNYELK